jgi:hypothetical protein
MCMGNMGLGAPMNRTDSRRFAMPRVLRGRASVWSARVFSAAFSRWPLPPPGGIGYPENG